MSKKYVIGANWKMNLTLDEADNLFQNLSNSLVPNDQREVLVFVPQPFLGVFKSNDCLLVAAQNFHAPELSGAFTGETSLNHLKSLDITTVLVGHSERRMHFRESNETVMLKARIAAAEGFRVVLCCGEPLEVRLKGEASAFNFVYNQIKFLEEWTLEALSKIVLAYEPIWAIGTGETPTLAEIEHMQNGIKSTLFDATGVAVPILYGGSCDAENSKLIFKLKGVDGGLIGGASLKATSLLSIISNAW
ncbi:MAG: triose-phosphate isomerase [Bacteroidota bacterium]